VLSLSSAVGFSRPVVEIGWKLSRSFVVYQIRRQAEELVDESERIIDFYGRLRTGSWPSERASVWTSDPAPVQNSSSGIADSLGFVPALSNRRHSRWRCCLGPRGGTSSICFSVNGLTSARVRARTTHRRRLTEDLERQEIGGSRHIFSLLKRRFGSAKRRNVHRVAPKKGSPLAEPRTGA